MKQFLTSTVLLLALTACEPAATANGTEENTPDWVLAGKLEAKKLDEASGLQAGRDGVYFLHNDGKKHIYAIDSAGRDLGRKSLKSAGIKDWEDLTRVMGEDGPLLVVADTGDNSASRGNVSLYFLDEPEKGDMDKKLNLVHKLDVRYPDGARDVEAISHDPHSDMILFLSKRDKPPRLYGIPRDLALVKQELEATFLGEIRPLRPPTRSDILSHPKRGFWVSQPTGMDISADGRLAAVITYRILYVYERRENESWLAAFQREPAEFVGPRGLHEEGVTFSLDQQSIFVATERRPSPLYRLDLDETVLKQIRHETAADP